MSKRVEVLILLAIAVGCGLAFWHYLDHDVVPLVKYGSEGESGVVIDPTGWLKIVASLFGAGGFGIATIVTAWKNFSQLLPLGNPFRRWGGTAVDAAQIAIYASAYRGAKTDEERTAAKTAMSLAANSLVDELCQPSVAEARK